MKVPRRFSSFSSLAALCCTLAGCASTDLARTGPSTIKRSEDCVICGGYEQPRAPHGEVDWTGVFDPTLPEPIPGEPRWATAVFVIPTGSGTSANAIAAAEMYVFASSVEGNTTLWVHDNGRDINTTAPMPPEAAAPYPRYWRTHYDVKAPVSKACGVRVTAHSTWKVKWGVAGVDPFINSYPAEADPWEAVPCGTVASSSGSGGNTEAEEELAPPSGVCWYRWNVDAEGLVTNVVLLSGPPECPRG